MLQIDTAFPVCIIAILAAQTIHELLSTAHPLSSPVSIVHP